MEPMGKAPAALATEVTALPEPEQPAALWVASSFPGRALSLASGLVIVIP